MTRCSICGHTTTAKFYKVEEARYFVGEGNICTGCFEAWRRFDYDYLDLKAVEKFKRMVKKNE